MMTPLQKLAELGLELPPVPAPIAAYIPAVRSGQLVFTSGQLPMREGKITASGKVPSQVGLEAAQAAARQAVLNGLAAINAIVGLDQIVRIIRLNVFVNSSAGFTDQAKVANGASELLGQIFGESGKHSRVAVGVAELPLNAALELDLTVEVA